MNKLNESNRYVDRLIKHLDYLENNNSVIVGRIIIDGYYPKLEIRTNKDMWDFVRRCHRDTMITIIDETTKVYVNISYTLQKNYRIIIDYKQSSRLAYGTEQDVVNILYRYRYLIPYAKSQNNI